MDLTEARQTWNCRLRQLPLGRYWLLLLFLSSFGSGTLLADPPPSRPEVVLSGVGYLRLEWVAGRLGMKYEHMDGGKQVRLSSRWTRLSFEDKSRSMKLNDYQIFLGSPIVRYKGRLYMAALDYDKTLQPLLVPQLHDGRPGLRTIMIDAGHGGKDPGCNNHSLGLLEKKLTLDVAYRLKKELELRGYRVFLTRKDDRYVPLSERSRLSRQFEADLFISLHFNAVGNRSVQGIETFVYTPQNQPSTARGSLKAADKQSNSSNMQDAWNALAGFYVHRQLIKSMQTEDRGLRRARFAVLKDQRCPGMLVELGFVTNYEEGSKIGKPRYRIQLAKSIADGVSTYHKTLQRIGDS